MSSNVARMVIFLLLVGWIIFPITVQKSEAQSKPEIATVPPPWAYGLESETGAPSPDRPDRFALSRMSVAF